MALEIATRQAVSQRVRSRSQPDRLAVPTVGTDPSGAEGMMRAERTDRTYRLEPLDSAGVFLGLGMVQCGLLGGGILLGVAALTLGLPLPAAALPVVASGGISFTRIGGHATWEWLPLVIGWIG